jgi:hypothetical protein
MTQCASLIGLYGLCSSPKSDNRESIGLTIPDSFLPSDEPSNSDVLLCNALGRLVARSGS